MLTYSNLQRYCSGILRNKANNSPNATWNTIAKAASYFLFSLRLLPPYTQLSQRHASIIAPSYIRACVGDALGMSLVTLDFPRVMYRNVSNLREYDARSRGINAHAHSYYFWLHPPLYRRFCLNFPFVLFVYFVLFCFLFLLLSLIEVQYSTIQFVFVFLNLFSLKEVFFRTV